MSLLRTNYEDELFESSVSRINSSKKLEFSYVANPEVIPDSKISYNIAKENDPQRFYIFDFLSSELHQSQN